MHIVVAEAAQVRRYAAELAEADSFRFTEISVTHQQAGSAADPDVSFGVAGHEACAVALADRVIFQPVPVVDKLGGLGACIEVQEVDASFECGNP